MGLLTDALAPLMQRRATGLEGPLPLTAARVVEWLSGPASYSGVRVSPEGALTNPAVYACVRIIAEDLASIPLILYSRQDRGRDRAVQHPLYALLHDAPNPLMTAMQFRETLQGHLLLRGNAYANIERDRTGRPVALWPLKPTSMERPVLSDAGTLLYTYRLPNGEPRALTQDQVLHLRGFSPDGILGYAPMELHRETVGWSMATREYSGRFFANSSEPRGVLRLPEGKTLSPEAASRLRTDWEALHRGLENSSRTAIFEDGIAWQQVGLSPEDSQLIEVMAYQVEDIARIYRVPLVLLQSHEKSTSWGTGIEQFMLGYVVHTLRPWLVRWEQQISQALLLQGERGTLFAKHLIEGMLRGQTKERYDAYAVARQWGWMSANDIREREDMNAIEGGDTYLQPLNMADATLAEEMARAGIVASS